MNLSICGTEYNAIKYRQELKSKNSYGEYSKIFIPVSDSSSVSLEISNDSSKYEGLDLLDDDVRLIIVSVINNFK